MKLCSITPAAAGGLELRVYEVGHAASPRRSSAVTRPLVSSLIFRIRAADGARSPLRYLLTEATETPNASAKSVCDMPCSDRNAESFIRKHYHDGNGGQALVAHLVTDNLSGLSYLYGMSTELDRLLKQASKNGVSAADIGRRLGVPPSRISDWRKGKRCIPDDKAIKLADELKTTPFDLSPAFNKIVLDSFKDPDDREAVRLAMKRAYRDQLRVSQREDVA